MARYVSLSGPWVGMARLLSVTDPAQRAREAASVLAERSGVAAHDVAVVLGSGWRPAADELGAPTIEKIGRAHV